MLPVQDVPAPGVFAVAWSGALFCGRQSGLSGLPKVADRKKAPVRRLQQWQH